MDESVDKENQTQRRSAVFYLVCTAILWSLGGVLIKLVSWNPMAIAGTRSLFASILMMVLMKRVRFTWSRDQIITAVAYTATVLLFVISNKMTTAANAILLQYTAPVYVAVLSAWILKEKSSWADWVTIAFVLGGMVLFFLDHLSLGSMVGNILAMASGVTFAVEIVFMRKQKDARPEDSVLLGNLLTALIGLPFIFQSMPSAQSWMGLLFLGIFQLGLAYVLYAKAIRHVSAVEGSIIPVIEPILNPIWVFLILGERPGTWALVGGIIVFCSVTLRCVWGAMQAVRKHEAEISA